MIVHNQRNMKTRFMNGVAAAALSFGLCSAVYAGEGGPIKFDVPAQPLDSALVQFSVQADTLIITKQEVLKNKKAAAIAGEMTLEEALSNMLEGTGLQYSKDVNGKIHITPVADVSRSIDGMADNAAEKEENAFVLEEIIVTATKRAESLQDVPVAISALSPSDIERQGIEGFEDYARQLPGVVLTQASKNAVNSFTIRGIATNAITEIFQQAVTVYIDEVPVTPTPGNMTPDLRLYDVERVEVLRGPQGTLFGSGTLAGAVRVITKKADLSGFDASASVDFGLTRDDSFRQRYNAMVNFPLIDDKLAVRIVGYYRNEEGYVDNIGTGIDNSDSTVDYGGRFALKWQPTDRLSASFMIIHQDSEPKDISVYNPTLGKHKRTTYLPDLQQVKMTNYNATLEYDFGGAQLTSSTTYSAAETFQRTDISAVLGGLYPWEHNNQEDRSSIVEELRLVSTNDSSFEWVVGGFYVDRNIDNETFNFTSEEYLQAQNITGLPDGRFSNVFTKRDVREMAAFGELSYHLSDTLTLTGGLRYASFENTIETLDMGFSSTGNLIGAAFGGGNTELALTPVAPSTIGTGKKTKLTKKLSLSWQPNDNQTYYALVSQGFRIDQPNSPINRVSTRDPNDPLIVPETSKSDSLWNYELGLKATWLEGRLKTNIAAYYIPWKDIQLQVQRVSDGRGFAYNAGKAVSKGIEAEIQAWPTNSLELGLNITLQSAKITSLSAEEAIITGAVEGHQLSSPDFQMALHIQNNWQLSNGQDLYARLDMQHVGAYPSGFPNLPGQSGVTNPYTESTEAYENVNVSVGWLTDNWSVIAYAENVLNNDNFVYIYPQSYIDGRYLTLRPRTFGIRASWKY